VPIDSQQIASRVYLDTILIFSLVFALKLRLSVRATGTTNSSLFYSLALGSVGILILFGYWLSSLSQSQIAPLSQDDRIQVYFNQQSAGGFTEPYRSQTRQGDDLAAIIISAIAGAQLQIDVAVQEFRLPHIAQALADRARAGVRVRVILENNYSRPWSELTAAEIDVLPDRERERYDEFRRLVDMDRDGSLSQAEIEQRDALIILRRANIPILDDTADGSKGSGLMHHKFMAIDGSKVILTSANWTMSDIYGDFTNTNSRGNPNNLVQIASTELAALFTTEFNLLWGDGVDGNVDSQFGVQKPYRPPSKVMVGNTSVTLQFSPTSRSQTWIESSNGLIDKWLANTHQQIDLALFVFSEPPLGETIRNQAQQGIKVRGLIDRQFAYRDYSQGLTLMGVGCSSTGDRVAHIGVPTLPTGDLLHHKFAILDRHTVITGSHNWSKAANYNNDEAVLIIENNPTVAAHFEREFERLYRDAAVAIPEHLQQQNCP
jgi:phosphatidylserine/phosphatidylglycerophosphate/cardiolipin synthase-like enzyme